MNEQPTALRLADALLMGNAMLPEIDLPEAAAELRRLDQVEAAYNEWHEKTEWVQATAHWSELGKHRADVLRQRIDRLTAINAQLLEALEDCVEDSQAAVDQYVLSYGENFRPHRLKGLREIVAKARAAIAAAKGEA